MLTKQRLAYLLVPVLYYIAARLAIVLTVMPEGIAILWLPNSIVLAALLLLEGRGFWRLLLLGVAAEVLADIPSFTLTEALVFGLINALEIGLAYGLLRRWQFSPRFETLADLGKFALAGPVIAAFSAAMLGALVYTAFGDGSASYLEWLRIWWFGDVLGLMVGTPLWLSLGASRNAPATGSTPAWRRIDRWMSVSAAVVVSLMLLAHQGLLGGMRIAPGLLLIFIGYLAARSSVRWTALAAGAAALFITVLVAAGDQTFGALPPRAAILETQRFIIVMSIMALGLAALLAQIRMQQASLAAANARLSQLNQDLEARVAERTAELRTLNAALAELAHTDALTGLLNRRAFLAAAEREIERSRRHQHPLAVMMIDMDYFKTVNDQYGHPAGDQVLQNTAALITSVIRATDLLARIGGEEFVLLAPETSLEQALALAGRLHQAVREQTVLVDRRPIKITASIGLTMLAEVSEGVDGLMRRADAALYAAKAAGRDRIVTVLANEAAPIA